MLPPLGVVIARGLNPSALAVLGDGALWQATLHSLAIASGATSFAFVLAAAVILASRHWRLHGRKKQADGIETLGAIILVVPSIVLSTGLFLLFRQFSDVFSLALWLVMAVNALMALPYLIKVLSAPAFQVAQSYHNLCATLGVRGITRLRLIEWDCLRAPIARGIAVSFVLSMGDLSAIALFGSQNFQTLPLYLFRLMGSYQMEAGAAAAMLLLLTSLGCYALLTRLIQWRHAC
ncbi:hypothetical protein BZG06_05325 [Salinivibrio kushneri]|nr:hypothetical protein BZG06_05325 [Salinivibrio kushneri]